jgi:hypothetical protein
MHDDRTAGFTKPKLTRTAKAAKAQAQTARERSWWKAEAFFDQSQSERADRCNPGVAGNCEDCRYAKQSSLRTRVDTNSILCSAAAFLAALGAP